VDGLDLQELIRPDAAGLNYPTRSTVPAAPIDRRLSAVPAGAEPITVVVAGSTTSMRSLPPAGDLRADDPVLDGSLLARERRPAPDPGHPSWSESAVRPREAGRFRASLEP
jgi:hypothetical protein